MNWIDFLTDNQVDFVTRGPNTKRGEVSIKCPWCSEDDPSQHLGISLTSENWGCLRNAAHRGHSPTHLVAAIIGCSSTQAGLVVAQYSESDPESLGVSPSPPESAPEPSIDLRFLRDIKPDGNTAKFWQYLKNRGFADTRRLIKQYRLACCTTGRFKDRIIIPFYRGGKLIAWSGRAIVDPKLAPRYLSSNLIKTTIFNEEQITGGRILYVVEGPFDAMKLDYYGQAHKVRATCGSGITMTAAQAVILNILARRFDKVIVLFDAGVLEQAFAAMDWLHHPNVKLGQLPTGYDDPGIMSQAAVTAMIQQELS